MNIKKEEELTGRIMKKVQIMEVPYVFGEKEQQKCLCSPHSLESFKQLEEKIKTLELKIYDLEHSRSITIHKTKEKFSPELIRKIKPLIKRQRRKALEWR
ncbi:MAG: hypothetical protein ACKVQC_10920 [Elusimicrobiota bacterium]